MARMSIDDKFLRDPRVTMLAERLGWSVYEARGRLLEVFAICYDQESEVISASMIDLAGRHVGLAKAMLECELARLHKGGKYIVSGAAERVAYLVTRRDAGRQGGLKRAKSSASIPKHDDNERLSTPVSTASTGPQASRNPPVPDVLPDSVPVPDEVPDRESGARARDPGCAEPDTTPTPEPVPQPHAEPPAPAITAPIAQAPAARMSGRDAPAPLADGGDTDRWCTVRWLEVNAHRARIAEANGLEHRPLHPMDDGRKELALRMREGYSRADIAHVIAVVVAEAEETKSLKWLGGSMFGKRRVDNALARSVADAKPPASATTSSGNGLIAVGRPRAPGDDEPRFSGPPIEIRPPMSPEERAARLAALAAPHQPPRTTGDA